MSLLPKSLPDQTRMVLDAVGSQFVLSDAKVKAITTQFVEDFKLGLSEYNHPMAMIPTFVTEIPNGSEKGTFMALDLGGTNFRVCEVKLLGNHEFELKQKKFKITEELKSGPATELFDYMAESVAAFMIELGNVPEEECLHLGMTFSFPVEQTALASGKLLTWTKGFSATGAKGEDVVRLLQDALIRKQVRVQVVALVNDTVGTLLTRAYKTGSAILGSIFGTGTNGAYVEDISALAKLRNASALPGSKMVVNTEWGAFDNARKVLPLTAWDNKVDRESINPRYQAFEKLISGMYLGEIARNVITYLVDLPPLPETSPPAYCLFGGLSTKQLNTHYGLDTALLSDVAAAKSADEIRAILVKDLGFEAKQVSDTDTEVVSWACDLIGSRSAALSACAVAAILIQCKLVKLGGGPGEKKIESPIEIGVDGSLVEHYPGFESKLREILRILVGQEVEKCVKIGLAKDGSGVGAALCALVALKMERTTEVCK